jgi:alanyl-tRNA synthetase
MTKRLYYTDAYLTSFAATVVDASDDGTRVYLDQTTFYPTSGGQPNDLGTIDGVDVADVIDEDERIAHVLASPVARRPSPVAGSPVLGTINWPRRYDHMQQHTGQHLVSAVFEDLFGYKTVSVHFGADYSTLDLDTESVSREQLVRVERRANEVVIENRPVAVTFEDAATAAGLRKPSDRTGAIRIVGIQDLDRSACGGTHVRSTGEIGAIALRGVEKIRKATRVEFLCGHRTTDRARRDFETLTRIAASLSASIDDVDEIVGAQSERLRENESARKRLEKELASYRARELYEAAPPTAGGVRAVVVRSGPRTMEDIRTLALAIISLPKSVVIAPLTEPPSILVATSEDSGADAGKWMKEALAAVGGRGGGSPRVAQGSVPNVDGLERVVEQIVSRVG